VYKHTHKLVTNSDKFAGIAIIAPPHH